MADTRDPIELLAQEPLVAFRAGDGYFNEEIVFSGHEISLDYFGHTL